MSTFIIRLEGKGRIKGLKVASRERAIEYVRQHHPACYEANAYKVLELPAQR